MRWLAYLHPIAMVGVLTLGLAVLREGARMRRARLRRAAPDLRRHTRLAKPFVILVAIGYGSGLASMGWIRGKAVYESPHALLTTAALAALLAAGLLGLRLERRASTIARRAHLACGAGGLLLALAAAAAGFDILP